MCIGDVGVDGGLNSGDVPSIASPLTSPLLSLAGLALSSPVAVHNVTSGSSIRSSAGGSGGRKKRKVVAG